MQIRKISARQVLDSNANWTIEAEVEFEDGSTGVGTSPGGLSRGGNEVDSIPAKSAENIIDKQINNQLVGTSFDSLQSFDQKLIELDGTQKKSNIGGNAMIALSIAFCRALAKSQGQEPYQLISQIAGVEPSKNFPKMMMLILEGGKHGSGAASIQEFMAVVDSVEEGDVIYNAVKKDLSNQKISTNVGVEGAFSPNGFDNIASLTLLQKHLGSAGIALDIAANSFEDKPLPDYNQLLESFPIVSIEDPQNENDWESWKSFMASYGDKIMVVADDLTTTNPVRTQRAIGEKSANAIIIKPNQIGTITETLEVVRQAKQAGWKTVVSHRGTDSNDDFIADLAIGINSEYVKFGAPARGERVAKYNRLLEILE